MGTSIWKHKGILPYLAVAFLNAFTDLGHKIVIVNILIKTRSGSEQMGLIAIANALILLPFVMTFTPAGYIADKYPKNKIISFAAGLAIPITVLITISYAMGAFWMAFGLTFILALQSAIYSPAKYGYIKELVGKEALAPANGAVQAVTIAAILFGTFFYSILFEIFYPGDGTSVPEILKSIQPLGYFLVATCIIERFMAVGLPKLREKDPDLKFEYDKYIKMENLRVNIRQIWSQPIIRLSIMGLGIFWGVNQVIVSSFSPFIKEVTGQTNTIVINGILAMAGVGIILGSIFASKVSKNFIETGIIPLGAIGMSFFLFIMPQLTNEYVLGAVSLAFGFFGGVFVVPLNTLIQFHARENELGRILAGKNFIHNLIMLAFLGGSIIFAYLELPLKSVFTILFVIILLGTFYTVIKIPQSLVYFMVRFLFSQHYKLQVLGLKNIPGQGGVLLLGNHISWLDWAILQMACPRSVRFVMHSAYYQKWYLTHILKFFKVIPITRGTSRDALLTVHEYLKEGKVVCIFPEGHISHNGHLSIFRTGFEKAAKDTGASIIPFYLGGLWGSRASYATAKHRKTTLNTGVRPVTVCFGKPLTDSATAVTVKQRVLETSIYSWKHYAENLSPLPHSFLQTARDMGGRICLNDSASGALSYTRLLAAVLAFSSKLKSLLGKGPHVGILLPAAAGGVIANMAVLFRGRTVVNLNYTTDPAVLDKGAVKADIDTILTSRLFLQKLEGRNIDMTPLFEGRKVLYMEDIKKSLPKWYLLLKLLQVRLLPAAILRALYCPHITMEHTAAILFSSGSEGVPKAIQLSHTNIMGNLKQTASVINADQNDIMLCALPLFHAFGLTITTFLPLIEGIPIVCHPDPTDAKTIGKLIAAHNVTILCATATFLRLYERSPRVHPLMLKSLRLVVAGAEKLRKEVRTAFKEKFAKDIYEGYGTTETTPVAGVNIPDILLSHTGDIQTGHKPGTVGLPLPGSRFKIVDPLTMDTLPAGEAGLILIGGTQIMKGYLGEPEKTADVIVEQDGIRWYKTGDRGQVDADGFLTILDRYSRFAKIGGEMVSLSSVEALVSELITNADIEFTAVNLPDSAKGEKVILLYSGSLDVDALKKTIREKVPPLMQPREFFQVEDIPKLGTGKVDFKGIKKLAEEVVGVTAV